MIHITVGFWFIRLFKFLKFVSKKFKADNIFVEKLVNKCRVKLKATFSDAEMNIMKWLVGMINKYKKVSPIQKTLLNKKYNEVFKKNTNEKIDDLCDYIITVYNKNF